MISNGVVETGFRLSNRPLSGSLRCNLRLSRYVSASNRYVLPAGLARKWSSPVCVNRTQSLSARARTIDADSWALQDNRSLGFCSAGAYHGFISSLLQRDGDLFA